MDGREPLADRLVRALSLDADVYAEVADREEDTGPALQVLLAACTLEAVSALATGGWAGFLGELALSTALFALWVVAIFVLAPIAGRAVAFAPLFRALGLASAPLALGLFQTVPWVGGLFGLGKWIFTLATVVTATGRLVGRRDLRVAGVVLGALAAAWLAHAPLLAVVRG